MIRWADRPALWIAAAFVVLNLPGLDRSPVVWIDEVTLNDPAKELARHGVLRSSVFAGRQGFEEHYFWQPPGQPLVTALVYKIAGFGIWQTRLPPLLFGAACLMALHALGARLLQSQRSATFATALYALDPKFLQVARSGRMDPQCLLFALLAVIACLTAIEVRTPSEGDGYHRRLAFSGFLVGVAGVTHPLGVAWALALGLLVLVQGTEWRKLTGLTAFGLAAALPAALWLAWVLRVSTFRVFAGQFFDHGEGHLARGSLLSRLAAEIAQYQQQYSLAPLLLIAYGVGLVWLLARSPGGTLPRRVLGMLFATLFLFNALIMTKGLGYYFLHPAAILALSAGGWLAAVLQPLGERTRTPAGVSGIAAWAWALLLTANVLAAGLAGRWLSLAVQWRERGYGPLAAAVGETVPPGSVVWGPAEVWYAVESAGSSLRLFGPPDPGRHGFAVLRKDSPIRLDARAVKLREVGQPLPPVLGLRRPSADYTFEIWALRPAGESH